MVAREEAQVAEQAVVPTLAVREVRVEVQLHHPHSKEGRKEQTGWKTSRKNLGEVFLNHCFSAGGL